MIAPAHGGCTSAMAESNEADRYLLDQIARGNADAWGQLVGRYHGRLLAFARLRLPRCEDADDFVQETFLRFLQSFRTFRAGASVETFLFTILRRRLIDHFRGRRVAACAIGDSAAGGAAGDVVGREPTPSWYARRDEQAELLERAVAAGLDAMIRRLRDRQKLDELRVIELLFYAQLRNKDVAGACGMNERQVALTKFRALAQVRDHVAALLPPAQLDALRLSGWEHDSDAADSILTRAWEALRPTCPKRSTLGRYLLQTLEPAWRDHVQFHVERLGCRFCQANLEDLRHEPQERTPLRERVFQSTVGFLSPRV
jgi:RNA polymerase sigma factor (sigma-70 family)